MPPEASPPASSPAVRRNMQAIRARDTKPERLLRGELHRRGLRFRKHRAPLPGLRRTADAVFPRERVAVFIDGCYWHGCPEHFKVPKSNAEFWVTKIDRNRQRDQELDLALAQAGWHVVRAFEHDAIAEIANIVEEAVRSRRAAS